MLVKTTVFGFPFLFNILFMLFSPFLLKKPKCSPAQSVKNKPKLVSDLTQNKIYQCKGWSTRNSPEVCTARQIFGKDKNVECGMEIGQGCGAAQSANKNETGSGQKQAETRPKVGTKIQLPKVKCKTENNAAEKPPKVTAEAIKMEIENKNQRLKRKRFGQTGARAKRRRIKIVDNDKEAISLDIDAFRQEEDQNDDEILDTNFTKTYQIRKSKLKQYTIKEKFKPKIRKNLQGGAKSNLNTKNNFKITAFFKPSLTRDEFELDRRVGSTSARQMKGGGEEVIGLKRGINMAEY